MGYKAAAAKLPCVALYEERSLLLLRQVLRMACQLRGTCLKRLFHAVGATALPNGAGT